VLTLEGDDASVDLSRVASASDRVAPP
jgi:hypothetical protein